MRCLAALLAFGISTANADDTPWYRERTTHLVLTATVGVLHLAADTFAEDALAPDTCRWCDPTPIERDVRDALVWDSIDHAELSADLTAYGLTPALAIGLFAIASSDQSASRWIDDAFPVVETVVLAQAITQLAKISFGRQRPLVHFGRVTEPSSEDNLSFWSGHTAFAFAVATSAGVVARRRGYAVEPYVWATGLLAASATAYFRIAADKHYLGDVLVGAAFGIGSGLVLPHLVTTRAASDRPAQLEAVPNGVAIGGAF